MLDKKEAETENNAFFVELGAKIKVIRKEKGIKSKNVAEILGLHPQVYGRYEKGIHRMPADIVFNVLNFLEVNFQDLMSNKTIKEEEEVKGDLVVEHHHHYHPLITSILKVVTKFTKAVGNMSGELAKNKIVVTTLSIAFTIMVAINIAKYFPINTEYGLQFIITQFTVLTIIVAIIVSFALPVSILTYIATWFAMCSIVALVHAYIVSPIFNSGNSNLKRIIIQIIALFLSVVYVQWLKKWKLKHDNKAKV